MSSSGVINLDSNNTIGNGLSWDTAGRVVVGKGVTKVLASASWNADYASGFRRVDIRKNNSSQGYAFTTAASGYSAGVISGTIFDVKEGDIIDLYNRETAQNFWTATMMTIIGF